MTYNTTIRILLLIALVLVFSAHLYVNHRHAKSKEQLRIIDSIYSADSLAYEYRRDSIRRVIDSLQPIAERRIKELLWKERQLDSINKLKTK